MTGEGGRDDMILGLDAGAQDYVVKPYDVIELSARVRAMAKLRNANREIEGLNNKLTDEVAQATSRLELLYRFVRELNQARGADEIYDLGMRTVQQATG